MHYSKIEILDSLRYLAIVGVSCLGSVSFLTYWLPLFLVGILLFLFLSKVVPAKEYYIISGFIVVFCLFKYESVAVVYTILPLIAVIAFKDFKIPTLHFLGKFSYSIYLIHPLISSSFINTLSHQTVQQIAKLFVGLSGLLITPAGVRLTYVCIEKPCKKFSSSVKY